MTDPTEPQPPTVLETPVGGIGGSGGAGDLAANQAEPGRDRVALSWLMPMGLVGLSFWNFTARLFTLGIYHFWGKTEVRRRVWSGIRLNGEPLVYTGRGMELFLGFLIVFFLILVPLFLIPFAFIMYLGQESPFVVAIQIALYVLVFFLFGVAVYRAQRYRLSRTTWRGIRGRLVGSPWGFAWTSFWTGLLTPFTLGWILPWRAMQLQGRLTNEMRFGNQEFTFKGSSEPLYWRFAILWFGTLLIYFGVLGGMGLAAWPALQELIAASQGGGEPPPEAAIGLVALIYVAIIVAWFLYAIVSAWYRARMINHFASCTKFAGLDFVSTVQARGLIYIAVTNFLIRLSGSFIFLIPGSILAMWAYVGLGGMDLAAVETNASGMTEWEKIVGYIAGSIGIIVLILALIGFGLFAPVTQSRRTGYLVSRISIDGTALLDSIEQGSKQDISTGEGLAEAFDIDAI